ncbi:MAG TPA: GlsB/YeaQ/YmgE family stress response membrane protein [Candidatus Avacidaminococcus intestinavium]|uniref:GlsB/YeaQ/YmgE family stress response membrane protein n=1 Tax=Candidatus Avacidaminococcus intestinavium TaxID=2840684 RepID=A0A9D1SL46_9FIRM|nr:GlsB/YeaQ/YmgE family stress response membrane protein [Candidatus Avacidaminococcus intestinavium]
MGIISWIIIGALAGWIASMLTGNNAKMGAIANISAGIVGAVIGGYVVGFFGMDGVDGFNLRSLMVSVVGAFILLTALNMINKK